MVLHLPSISTYGKPAFWYSMNVKRQGTSNAYLLKWPYCNTFYFLSVSWPLENGKMSFAFPSVCRLSVCVEFYEIDNLRNYWTDDYQNVYVCVEYRVDNGYIEWLKKINESGKIFYWSNQERRTLFIRKFRYVVLLLLALHCTSSNLYMCLCQNVWWRHYKFIFVEKLTWNIFSTSRYFNDPQLWLYFPSLS